MAKQTNKLAKQSLIVFALMAIALSISAFAPVTFAQLINPGDSPANIREATGGEESARGLILQIVNYFLFFLGLLATIMVIYGGVTYVTSAGEQDKADKAKKIIGYAVVGIIIILLSFVLVNAVIGAGLGNNATT